ncbi:MAG: S8 family serine peptidase [Patescibacteria group bacterium]
MKKSLVFGIILMLIAVPVAYLKAYDPLVDEQWYLDRIDAQGAWTITAGDRDVIVAVLDTGVDITHPDLAGNIWVNADEWGGDGVDNDKNGYIDDINGYDFYYDYFQPTPELSFGYDEFVHHGTIVAGIIAAVQNGQGMQGVASHIRIMPIKVLDEFGYGDTYALAQAIDYAVANGADIINLSLESYDDPVVVFEALNRAAEKNVITVAASGNGWFGEGVDLDADPVYPICYDSQSPNVLVVGVGATDFDNNPSVFSNFGGDCVDVSAPGEGILGTKIHSIAESIDDYYGADNDGTSFSAAIVSGVIALMKSLNRSLTNEQILSALTETADFVPISYYMTDGDMGKGIINAHSALKYILQKYGASDSRWPWNILVSAQSGGNGELMILDKSLAVSKTIKPYGNDFKNGFAVELFDVNGDGNNEYVVGPAAGQPPILRALSLSENILASKLIFEPDFFGGINLGKIKNQFGENNIVVCSGPGRRTEVLIANDNAEKLYSFFPFDDNAGCMADAGDLDGDGVDEIVVSSLQNNTIKIYDQEPRLLNKFVAYDSAYRGVNISVADLNQDGQSEILAGPVSGLPLVRVFNQDGQSTISFMASGFIGGVKVKATNYNESEDLELAVSPQPGQPGSLRIFDLLGKLKAEVDVFGHEFSGGLNISTGY